MFWAKEITGNILRTKANISPPMKSPSSVSDESSEPSTADRQMFRLPFSVVSTVEASDWLVLVRMVPSSLQSKGPVVRGVMAACVGHVQCSPLENHTSIRLGSSYRHSMNVLVLS